MAYSLFYLAGPIYGGWVSFTAHLALKHELPVYKIGNSTEEKFRSFGYGVDYRNIIPADIKRSTNHIIVAIDKNHYKYLENFPNKTWIVIHDPSEVTKKDSPQLLEHLRRFRVITIRESVKHFLKEKYNLSSLFLIHPFYPYAFKCTDSPTGAVSIARIDFDKHTDIILKANQLLPKSNQIALYGFANRQYVHFKLHGLPFRKAYKGTFPKTFIALNDILKDTKYCIDMSIIKHDGGGTQYTFLESIYQGVALVINKQWVEGYKTPFKPRHNCFTVGTPEELAELLKSNPPTTEITKRAREILEPYIKINWIARLRHVDETQIQHTNIHRKTRRTRRENGTPTRKMRMTGK